MGGAGGAPPRSALTVSRRRPGPALPHQGPLPPLPSRGVDAAQRGAAATTGASEPPPYSRLVSQWGEGGWEGQGGQPMEEGRASPRLRPPQDF